MYFKKGSIYVNFGGTEMVRFLAAKDDNILTANLRLPGGTKQFKRDHFEREFTEKVELTAVSNAPEVKPETPKKYIEQKWNHYHGGSDAR